MFFLIPTSKIVRIILLQTFAISSLLATSEFEVVPIDRLVKCEKPTSVDAILTLQYSGPLKDGKLLPKEDALRSQTGMGHMVVPSWLHKGLVGVCTGDRLKLIVPRDHFIPADKDTEKVEFEVRVVSFEKKLSLNEIYFPVFDKNGDKRLSREEVEAYLTRNAEDAKSQGLEVTMDEQNQAKATEKMFERMDLDRDDYITFEEFSNARRFQGRSSEEL